MIDVVPKSGMIKIGKQGENRAIRVILPNIRAGSGSILLLHQRALDKKPYPVPVAETAEGIIWVVSSTDTANQGRGQAELQWLGENGEVVKSVTYQTETARSLSAPGAVPDEPLKPYTQAVAKDAQAAKDAAASAKESARSSEASATQAGAAANNAADSLKRLEDGIASGEFHGQDGKSAYQLAVDAGFDGTEAQWLESLKGAPGDTTAADAAAEAAKKAAQEAQKAAEASSGSAAQAVEAVDRLADDLAATKKDLATTKRAVKFQAELSKGQTWDFETDTKEVYQRQVPSGAKAGAVMEIGEKTVGWNQLWESKARVKFSINETVNADGTSDFNGTFDNANGYGTFQAGVEIVFNRINQHTYLGVAPKSLDRRFGVSGYGVLSSNGRNLFVWTAPKSTKNWRNPLCIEATMGDVIEYRNIRFAVIDLTILYGPGNEPTDTTDPRIAQIEAYAAAHPEYNAGELVSALVDEMRVVNSAGDSTDTYPIPAAVQALPGYGWSAGSVANTIERTENGWQYVQRVGSRAYQEGDKLTDGTTTYYALATPITTDITDLMGDSLAPFLVEAGGSITFHHPKADEGFAVDVPAKIQYITKLSEVSANG